MAQVAIPLLMLGTAYLVCNDNSKEEEKEGFTELKDQVDQDGILSKSYDTFSPNVANTSLNVNNEETLSARQDKYMLSKSRIVENESNNIFENMAGETVKYGDINHNNMQIFYNNKSNGGPSFKEYDQILDNYTGNGSYEVAKMESASFFKPEDNLQNVYGNQNTNDFMQSRVVASNVQSNTKPWEEKQVAPGIGLGYDGVAEDGFNSGYMNQSMWAPKSVDELRTANNPKLTYKLDDHVGPALMPVQNRGIQGKIVKQGPDTYFTNDNNLGMVAGGISAQAKAPKQMITQENRDTTSVSYYGIKGPGDENKSYVDGKYSETHKQQLPPNPFINMSAQNINPTNESNYGRSGYNALPNNRSTTRIEYYGSLGNIVKQVVQPIVNGLRHSKKTNFVKNKDNMGNVSGVVHASNVVNSNAQVSTTNREMYEGKLSMNHLNVQKQDATAYMNTRPIVEITQRSTMNQNETGPAMNTSAMGTMSYESVYNQHNNDRLYAENVAPTGNMSLFNSSISVQPTNKEVCNDRSTPVYIPTQNNYNHPSELLGEFTSMPQKYESSSSNIDASLLDAFKNNPYTQPLNSAV